MRMPQLDIYNVEAVIYQEIKMRLLGSVTLTELLCVSAINHGGESRDFVTTYYPEK